MPAFNANERLSEKSNFASQFRFHLNADKSKLLATCELVKAIDKDITLAKVIETINILGFSDLYIIESAVSDLIKAYLGGKKSGSLVIAERRDGQAIIHIDNDNVTAKLEIIPAYGGRAAGLVEIKQALIESGVTSGLKREILNQCLKTGEATNVVVAEGIRVIHGKNTEFEMFVPEVRDRRPRINADGTVDDYSIEGFYIVEKGTELVRRHPVTMGSPGKNLAGETIDPIPGVDLDLVTDLEGVELSQIDENLLIASKKGQPVITNKGVYIEEIMQVKNVDLATGDIVFDGSVHVAGDVVANSNIEATGDVLIEGVVEASNITAGGNVVILGSVIGRGEVFDQNGNPNSEAVLIQAEGSVQLNIVENVRVKSGDRIFVRELVSRCDLCAFNEIIVGDSTSKAGRIVGGKTRSGILISANIIGSSAGAKTELEICGDDTAKTKLKEVTEKCIEADEKLKKFETIIRVAKTKQSESSKLYQKLLQQRGISFREYSVLDSHKSLLRKEVKRCKDGKIDIKNELFSGLVMRIGNRIKKIAEDSKGRVFKIVNDSIQ